MPIMKECNSRAWIEEVKRRVVKIENLAARVGLAGVEPSTRKKLADDTRRSMVTEVRELMASAEILYGEIVNEAQEAA